MAARSIQIPLDPDLLAEVDRQPETRRSGRSAVIRRALRLYLEVKRRAEIDRAYTWGYRGRAGQVFDEFADLLGGSSGQSSSAGRHLDVSLRPP